MKEEVGLPQVVRVQALPVAGRSRWIFGRAAMS